MLRPAARVTRMAGFSALPHPPTGIFICKTWPHWLLDSLQIPSYTPAPQRGLLRSASQSLAHRWPRVSITDRPVCNSAVQFSSDFLTPAVNCPTISLVYAYLSSSPVTQHDRHFICRICRYTARTALGTQCERCPTLSLVLGQCWAQASTQ